jgi:hypothetical protein
MMELKKDVKALQVRLPADVYDSLQYEASAKASTMNAVVVECLRANLPNAHWTDFALVRDLGIDRWSPEILKKHTQDTLGMYESKVLGEIALLNSLIQMRVHQLGSIGSINKALREGWEVLPPTDGNLPGGSQSGFTYQMKTNDTNNLSKTEEKVKDVLKALARARAEEQIELRRLFSYLCRLTGKTPDGAPDSPHPDEN